jgi:hypothetical protein
VAYCRWHWRFLEPEQGRYNFTMIDQAFARAKERGQTVAIRLMPFGDISQPQLPEWYVAKYPTKIEQKRKGPQRMPDHDAPEYLQHFGGLIVEFAKRYANHPLLETIDMAYIGPWGEGAGECSPQQCDRFVALFKKSFPHTPRLALIEGYQMRAGIVSGSGWRCDSYGDVREIGSQDVPSNAAWNHMYDAYPHEVIEGGAVDAWKTAPVHLEVGAVPLYWQQFEYDLDFILEQGLKYHATYFMPKHTQLPEAWLPKFEAFCRRLGYHFVFRQANLEVAVKRGATFNFKCWIENTGVAPLYRRYDLALRLRQQGRTEIIAFDDVDVRTWLPGDVSIQKSVKLPGTFSPGTAELSVGLVDPQTKEARVSFATKECFSDRWLNLGGIEVQ